MRDVAGRPAQILLVEDSPGDTRLISEMLQGPGDGRVQLETAAKLSAVVEILRARQFDIILLDLFLSDSQGIDTMLAVRKHAGETPIVVFTGLDNKEVSIDCVRFGAQDYLVKEEVDRILLRRVMRHAIEREKLEREVRKSRDVLEKTVAERTKDLVETNVRLRETDRLKSMFLASMSHELRTPLNAILGFTGIILQGMSGTVSGEQTKQLNMVRKSAEHLLSLINDVIDISKIESGKITPEIDEVNLAALAREARETFVPLAEKKGVTLEFEAPESLLVRSDSRRIMQVIINLAGNAVKFTDKGAVSIGLEEKNGMARVMVRDSGPGIREDDMDRLFHPFSKLTTISNSNQEGSGIGLYLSRRVADLLGGKITAESEVGRGSRFIFTLPLAYEEKQEGAGESQA